MASLPPWMLALGLGPPPSWLWTLVWAAGWTAVMYALSPVADWVATGVARRPPNLEAFRAIQQSRVKLVAGIVIAWILGAVIEEAFFRGVVLQAVDAWLQPAMPSAVATGIAIATAALGAGLAHLYQGPRGAIIATQLSVLFGLLFVLAGRNLWAVILCHGFYDTLAFIRFAAGKSKYSRPAAEAG